MNLSGKRILLKLSGEALMGGQEFGIDPAVLDGVAEMIASLHGRGYELAVVIGGGNLFRGVKVAAHGGDRVTGDHMGMLATVMNGLSIGSALKRHKCDSEVFSALAMPTICDTYTQRDALKALDRGAVAVLTAGTGNPFVTTDTGAAIRAAELGCAAIVKATKVDGVYDSDPVGNPDAKRYDSLSYDKAIRDGLAVMDAAAISLARDADIPIIVCAMTNGDSVAAALEGTGTRTLVCRQERGAG